MVPGGRNPQGGIENLFSGPFQLNLSRLLLMMRTLLVRCSPSLPFMAYRADVYTRRKRGILYESKTLQHLKWSILTPEAPRRLR